MSDKIIIFTDGGCRGNQKRENIGAWAFTLDYKGKRKERSQGVANTTNNIMELNAILEALKTIKPTHRSIPTCLYSDSAYCVDGINNWRHGWKKRGWTKSDKSPVENLDLWTELDSVVDTFTNLQVIKVKGHNGNIGNERVDELCNLRMDELK